MWRHFALNQYLNHRRFFFHSTHSKGYRCWQVCWAPAGWDILCAGVGDTVAVAHFAICLISGIACIFFQQPASCRIHLLMPDRRPTSRRPAPRRSDGRIPRSFCSTGVKSESAENSMNSSKWVGCIKRSTMSMVMCMSASVLALFGDGWAVDDIERRINKIRRYSSNDDGFM